MPLKFKAILSKKQFLLVILFAILMLAAFFRWYKAVQLFEFGHDGDLYSWMVKDVLVNHHLRLIGQETSSKGIFLGPLFYYLIIPFFLLTNMEPTGVVYLGIILGVLTTFAFYLTFKSLFNQTTGLIAAFLNASLIDRINYDRWIVPTVTGSLWEIGYLYCVLSLTKGNFKILLLLGLLVGLIWHINLGLLPLLICIPLAIFLSKKLPIKKDWLMFLAGVLLSSIPLIIFEIKDNFGQTRALFASFFTNQGGGQGLFKLTHVLSEISGNIISLFTQDMSRSFPLGLGLILVLLIAGLFLTKSNLLNKKMLFVIYAWIALVVVFFTVSSKIISEYYFHDLEIVFLTIFILVLSFLYQKGKAGKLFVLLLLYFIALNSFAMLYQNNELGYYLRRKAIAEFIRTDSAAKKFPCVAVSYITTPGNDVGFRYLFYLKNMHVNQPISGSPVYTIVVPETLVTDRKFGYRIFGFGVIPPEGSFDLSKVNKSCSGANSNLTDPLFGFVQ